MTCTCFTLRQSQLVVVVHRVDLLCLPCMNGARGEVSRRKDWWRDLVWLIVPDTAGNCVKEVSDVVTSVEFDIMFTVVLIHLWDGLVDELSCPFAHDQDSRDRNVIVQHTPNDSGRSNAKGLFMDTLNTWAANDQLISPKKQAVPPTRSPTAIFTPVRYARQHQWHQCMTTFKRTIRGSARHCVRPLSSHVRRIIPR